MGAPALLVELPFQSPVVNPRPSFNVVKPVESTSVPSMFPALVETRLPRNVDLSGWILPSNPLAEVV